MGNGVDLVVIAAHPDDAELAVGGILLTAKAKGHRTAVIDLTRGELSSRGDLRTREEETARATEILGLDRRVQLDLGDGAVRDTPEARERLAQVLRELAPRIYLAPWKDDLHPDHAGAGRLAAATWYLCGVRKFAGESTPPHRPEMFGYYMCHTPFDVSAVIDVSAVWERRMEAARAYASQFHQEGVEGAATKIAQPHFFAAVEGRAREYGLLVGAELGEPIRWEHPPRIDDPVTFFASRDDGSSR